ncbi:MAG TPA: hypothetical protein PKC30_07825 [Saprospiraceae bacterium]|nr:hypothetical protein [Saprospiraceae bacterium]
MDQRYGHAIRLHNIQLPIGCYLCQIRNPEILSGLLIIFNPFGVVTSAIHRKPASIIHCHGVIPYVRISTPGRQRQQSVTPKEMNVKE